MSQRNLYALLLYLLCNAVLSSEAKAADENLLAYRLFNEGRYAQAAEIFTDPAWKGIALYRSSQWWRAAEAFVRANDALSAYNLGNTYVQLGYYELALEAYQQSLALDATLEDAQHNADIMRKLLASKEEEKQRSGRQSSGSEIDRLETEEPEDGGQGEDGEEQTQQGENAPGESSDDGTLPIGKEQQAQAQAGQGGEASDDNQRPDDPQGEGSGAIDGKAAEEAQPDGRPSGGSETDEPEEDAAAAGVRTELETEQATTQWLNRIQHNPQLFLQRRLKLEQQRRRAAGQTPPQGGSSW